MPGETVGPAWKLFGERLAPGLYAYGGETHLVAEEICAAAGMPYTERNLALLIADAARRTQDQEIAEVVS